MEQYSKIFIYVYNALNCLTYITRIFSDPKNCLPKVNKDLLYTIFIIINRNIMVFFIFPIIDNDAYNINEVILTTWCLEEIVKYGVMTIRFMYTDKKSKVLKVARILRNHSFLALMPAVMIGEIICYY